MLSSIQMWLIGTAISIAVIIGAWIRIMSRIEQKLDDLCATVERHIAEESITQRTIENRINQINDREIARGR